MLRLSSIFQNSLKHLAKESIVKNSCVVIQDRKYVIGELIQRFRFKFMTNTRHHLDYDKWCKIFAIEGNIGVGKNEIAKKLAERLDLRHYPTTTHQYLLDRLNGAYADEYIDWLRNPESVWQRSDGALSLDFFTKEPSDWLHTGKFQVEMLKNRYIQYCDVLAHILETGQGVASVRSFYSDVVFAEALLRMGWLRKDIYNHYNLVRVVANDYLLHPQVVLYLDMPAEQCYEHVQANGNEFDKRLPLEFFKQIEIAYKSIYLPYAREHGVNVIELDWSNPVSFDQLVEGLDEMENLNAANSRWLVKERVQFNRYIRLAKDINYRTNEIRIFLPVEEFLRSQVTDHTLRQEEFFCPYSKPKGLNSVLGDKNIWLKQI